MAVELISYWRLGHLFYNRACSIMNVDLKYPNLFLFKEFKP